MNFSFSVFGIFDLFCFGFFHCWRLAAEFHFSHSSSLSSFSYIICSSSHISIFYLFHIFLVLIIIDFHVLSVDISFIHWFLVFIFFCVLGSFDLGGIPFLGVFSGCFVSFFVSFALISSSRCCTYEYCVLFHLSLFLPILPIACSLFLPLVFLFLSLCSHFFFFPIHIVPSSFPFSSPSTLVLLCCIE